MSSNEKRETCPFETKAGLSQSAKMGDICVPVKGKTAHFMSAGVLAVISVETSQTDKLEMLLLI